MNSRSCPDCTTGWRHADEVEGGPGGGLVPCPTCDGTGRVVEGGDADSQTYPHGAETLSPAIDITPA